MAKKTSDQQTLEVARNVGGGGIPAYVKEAGKEAAGLVGALGSATVAQPQVLTPEVARQRLNAEEAAKKQAASQAAQPQQQSALDIVKALLGLQTGTIPQGYANFFTDVLGPMMQQQASDFDKQLKATGADPNVIANLMAINDATAKQTGLGAQGLQQFVLGPLGQQQALLGQLKAALQNLPYQTTVGANPLAALVGQSLGVGAGGPSGATPANPFGVTTPGQNPFSQ